MKKQKLFNLKFEASTVVLLKFKVFWYVKLFL